MQKTKLLLFVCSLFMMGAVMAETTTDRVVLSELTVEPGGEYGFFSVSLEGATTYTAYEVHLFLPDGLEVYHMDGAPVVYMASDDLSLDGNDIYPFTKNLLTQKKTYTHSVSSNVMGDELIVTCISTKNEDFKATSGTLFHVFVQASPYLKPGDVEIEVKDVVLVTKAETKYLPEDYVSTAVQAAATSTLTLKVSATNKFGTSILPFDYALPADGSLEAYTCEAYTDDALVLTKVTEMAAYTPYILYSENGFSATISGTVDAAKYPAGGTVKSGHLVGTLVQTELTEGSYVMQNQGDGPMFYRVGAVPFALSAGKCYVELPEGTNVASLRIGGSTTGIAPTQNATFNSQFSIFNLLGQPVSNMLPGRVYVVNGRKVVIAE